MKKQIVIFILLSALCLALSGCRTRIVSTPEKADTVLLSAQVPEPTPTPAPTPEPPQTPEPTPTPMPTEQPLPSAEPEETEPPEEPAETPPVTPPPIPATPSPVQTPPPVAAPPANQTPPVETTMADAPNAEAAETAETGRPELVTGMDGTGQELLRETAETGITVTYHPNGGDSPTQSTTVHPGEPYGVQPDATRHGYALDGWWTAPEGGEQVFASTPVSIEEAHTLYAHWQAREGSTVTFDGNGGRVKSREARQTISDGDAFGTMPTPLREGYHFLGWFTAPDGGDEITAEDIYTGTADLALYAGWEYDPFEFWSFTLQNKTQQIYMCQQTSFYFELAQDNVTQQYSGLIADTGSLNIAENRADPAVTDDWVLAKRPQAVIKCVGSMGEAAAARQAAASRFPEQEIVVVTADALGSGPTGLYARLALAKHYYGDWYTDIDLDVVSGELGVTSIPIQF